MMEPVRRVDGTGADPVSGNVEYDVAKMVWNLGMISAAVVFAPLTIGVDAFVVFLISTYLSLLIGHSAGMHRMMIHRTFQCRPLVAKMLIYVGVLVGMSGPFGIIKIHDLRDWAQRQPECHDFFSHKRSYWRDVWWQLTCRFVFDRPPEIVIESRYANSRFYKMLDRTWRYHQILPAVGLYYVGGWSYVVWGVFVRISVSIVGHWSITYFCHNPGPGHWRVADAAVQASNIPGLGLVTYGECWHNNHHAFPESARIGLEKGQSDPAYRFIQLLGLTGMASNIGMPRPNDQRDDLFERPLRMKADDQN
jgi:stearoyl-CoA desaturase (delta-9 desaturase)